MEHNPPPNIPEDYKVWAKISKGDKEFTVPCKIYLPKTVLEHPQVYIFPDNKQFDVLPRLREECSLDATVGDPPYIEIIGEDLHVSGGTMRPWEKGLEEGYLKVYPSRLIIRDISRTCKENVIWFRLTPSEHLKPFDQRSFRYNGKAEIKHGKRFEFELNDDFLVTFFNYYWWQENDKRERTTFPELIAEAKIPGPFTEDDIDEYIELLDDFLLLVSLAEGQRCTVPQVNVTLKDKHIDIFRLNRSFPKISETHSFNSFVTIQRKKV